MVNTKQLRKVTWYPRPHTEELYWEQGIDQPASTYNATMVPLIRYDEGQGSPSSYKANPEHASFAEYKGTGCYPKSEITKFFCELELHRTLSAINTDKLPIKIGLMMINMSFEDALAKDELSSSEIQDILEVQRETTDRQTYPLYNSIKVKNAWGTSGILHADQPGLTSSQLLEHIDFDADGYYDALQYKTNAKKLMKCQSGIHWVTLTQNNPVRKFHFFNKSKTQTIVPYGFLGLMIICAIGDSHYQFGRTSDWTTNIEQVGIQMKTRYLEWNEHFDMQDM